MPSVVQTFWKTMKFDLCAYATTPETVILAF